MNQYDQVQEAVAFIQSQGFENPEIGIILGTGLGGLTDHIDIIQTIDYEDIPHFPVSTVEFHHGKLIYGKLEDKTIVAMQGRFHYYEGYSLEEVVFPVRVLKYLGIQKLLVSNACGCMNLNWKKGELMLISDHINLLPDSPLRGKNAPLFGQIFVDLSEPYDILMNLKLTEIAKEHNINLRQGVYVAVAGPNLETKAEYRYLKQIGADVVGMSTIPEVIAANQMKLPVSAISVMTDECDPDSLQPVDINDILATAKEAEKDLIVLLKELMSLI